MSQEQVLNDIVTKVARLEVLQETNTRAIGDMTASVNRLVDKLDMSDDIAKEALDKAKSAHHRLDTTEDRQKWFSRTSIGAFIAGAVAFFWKGYGG